MPPASFRLDTLAVLYISRLEATRRAHVDDDAATTEAIRRITTELVASQAADCQAMLGDEAQARRIQREGLETFLPRYTRLAIAQNKEELRPGLVADNILARTAAALVGLGVATVFMQLIPSQVDLLLYAIPVAAPFLPEIKSWSARRRYSALLQELADDLGELQDAEDKLAPTPGQAAEPAAPNPTRNAQRAAEGAPPTQRDG